MDRDRGAAEMGCSTAGPSSRKSPVVTYKRRKRDSTLASSSRPQSDTSIEEDYKEFPSESEWPSFGKLRLETRETVDTAGSCDDVIRTIPESKRTVAPHSAKRSRQYFLDLGQADFTHTTCRTCGLVYARGLESDEKIHNSFHRSQLKGISFKGWIGERVAHHVSSAGDRVIYVVPGDPSCHVNKVREVVKVMEQEMGLSPGWLWQKQRCKVYLFISASKKIVGCVVAERIESAFPIIPRDQGDSKAHSDLVSSANRLKISEEKTKSSTQLLWGGWKFNREVVNRKKSRDDNQQDLGRAILCSKTGVPAVCGVRGIWVSRSERRKGVASHLLDAMRKTFCLGVTLKTSQCAFSQPSPAGEAFAARYCSTQSSCLSKPTANLSVHLGYQLVHLSEITEVQNSWHTNLAHSRDATRKIFLVAGTFVPCMNRTIGIEASSNVRLLRKQNDTSFQPNLSQYYDEMYLVCVIAESM